MLHLRQQPPVVSPSLMMRGPSSPAAPPPPASSAPNPSQRRIHQMLSNYISTIRREDFLPRLNHMLRSSCTLSGNSAMDIQSYYADRPELRNYTLGVELDRDLDYTLILEDGQSVTDKTAIRDHFGYRKNNDEKTDQYRGNGNVSKKELLIRASNQSLLADALVALTGSEEVLHSRITQKKIGLILPGPTLSMTSVVEKCHFTVDLQGGRVEAICVLAISVPIEDRRLVLARAILIANFQPGKKSRLQYEMQLVKAHHFPLSKTLYDASISLAQDEENLLFQNSHEDNSLKTDAKLHRPFSLFG